MRHTRIFTLFALGVFLSAFILLPACGRKSLRSEQMEPTPEATIVPTAPTEEGTPSTLTPVATGTEVMSLDLDASTATPTATATVTFTPTVADYSYVPETVTMEEDDENVRASLKKAKAKPQTVSEPTKVTTPVRASAAKKHSKAAALPAAAQAAPTTTPVPTPPPPAPTAVPAESVGAETVPQARPSSSRLIWLLILFALLGGAWYYWRKHQEADDSFTDKPSAPLGGLSPVSGYFAKGKKRPASGESKRGR